MFHLFRLCISKNNNTFIDNAEDLAIVMPMYNLLEYGEYTEVLKSNICDYNDAYILVKDDITVTVTLATQVAFKNCAPFTKCTTKIDWATIDDDTYIQNPWG